MKRFELQVDGSQDGIRLDRFLRGALAGIPARSIRHAIESAQVSVDGRRRAKGDPVRRGEIVLAENVAETSDWEPLPGDVEGASVLYRDAFVAVLEKPAGIPTEPTGIREPGTLAGYFRWRFPETRHWCTEPGMPLLSRLDTDTSGAVLAAMTEPAWRKLLAQRQDATIAKRYLCVVGGRIDGPAVLKAAIETRGGARVTVRMSDPEPAPVYWTRIRPLETDGRTTLVSAEILKGKRHQIRAHLAAAGHPIVGDRLYGKGEGERLMLHAAEVTFDHPDTGERTTVASPAPKGFCLRG